ncbi:sensor histidine kinase [Haloplanus salinarum]|uniref:receiver/sensor box histidine kinase n=1 Tax=Haloplanus salinarum TaxID=1912324 RepID=UPI00214A9AFD|nr:HAMP domain-containing sensor histidine kinase [Haloplanus salinarum]
MERLSTRQGGSLLVSGGLLLVVVHLTAVVRAWPRPEAMAVRGLLPLLVALSVVWVGVSMFRGGYVPEGSGERILAWVGGGAAVFAVATAWLFLTVTARGPTATPVEYVLFGGVTLGAAVGLAVGVYDARVRRQRRRTEQLTRINDTLRIATREVVNATDREELETTVCEQLTRSNVYDSAWIGRYVPETESVRPVAWAGHEEEYIESLDVSVDPSDPVGRGPGGKAIRTKEIQPVQDVFAEPSLEPWWDMLAEKGVESMAVVPLVGEDAVYGFLSIYANRGNVFDATEQEALSDLGESIGHALDSMTARDRLARREGELARQNERLDEFASVVSHDLRNPLNVAQGNLELAVETAEGDDAYLERVSSALDRMDELIDDVLTLARNGRTVSEFHPVDLESVVERAWNTTDTEGATLVVESDLGTVQGDEQRLAQVFENLFRNCVEHGSTDNRPETESFTRGTADGADRGGDATEGVTTVTVGRTDGGFYVADDGPGIPEDERERVFETGYSTDPDGTGFGLNIVRNIAEAHGWSVGVTESADGGARFEFDGVAAGGDERVEPPRFEDE